MVNKKFDPSLVAISVILLILAFVVLLPFYNAVVISLISNKEYQESVFVLWPRSITFQSYSYVFGWSRLFRAAGVTSLVTLIGVPYSMFLSITAAYALTKPIPGRKFFIVFIMFTMFFNGGLVPTYILIASTLNLTNNIFAMILPFGLNIWYMLLMQGYLRTISPEFEESARIDGAGDITIFVRIVLPLCKPMLATIALYCAVDRWNEWYNGMLYMNTSTGWPLQFLVRTMIESSRIVLENLPQDIRHNNFAMGIQMAVIIVTIIPIAIVFPFMQKYFAKGLTLGGVKG